MIIPEPVTVYPNTADLPREIAQLPAGPGVYVLRAAQGHLAHMSWSAHLRRRLSRLLVSSYTASDGRRSVLREQVMEVSCWPTGSKLETSILLFYLARNLYPDDYNKRLRLRMPWFAGMGDGDDYPRLMVMNRIARGSQNVYGPFPSREAAQRYEEELQGLFQMRRCPGKLAPAPDHPGCIYGEMNLCMRPCQLVVSQQEYLSEAQRMTDFLSTNGRAAVSGLTIARERASEKMDFEQAAQLHNRIERMRGVAALRDDVVADARRFRGVALTRSAQHRTLSLWLMFDGFWQGQINLEFPEEGERSKSLDREIREKLETALREPQADGRRVEHLAVFARWYFSSWRDGQWFPFRGLDDLNYKKLVRGISNLLKTAADSC
ncbi:MAG TPA: UvrB/UvrC motif-containing protein [Bryobacteraceae bacterium]|nr:UvrB/UvrC motif-containing protein [Bryobacteraceae bacterium]